MSSNPPVSSAAQTSGRPAVQIIDHIRMLRGAASGEYDLTPDHFALTEVEREISEGQGGAVLERLRQHLQEIKDRRLNGV